MITKMCEMTMKRYKVIFMVNKLVLVSQFSTLSTQSSLYKSTHSHKHFFSAFTTDVLAI